MDEIDTITITVKGPTQSGKSAVAEEIRQVLDYYGYACVHMKPETRNCGNHGLNDSAYWEKPRKANAVFCIVEKNEPRK